MTNNKKTEEKKQVIITNSMFTGSYGLDHGNLPHEIINIFRADDECFYVYLTPYGLINKDLLEDEIDCILFVRSTTTPGLIEIIGKASGILKIYSKNISFKGKTSEERFASIKANVDKMKDNELIIEQKNIRYGGKTLADIHKTNKDDFDLFVTCKVEKICLAKEPIYIQVNNSLKYYNSEIKKIDKQPNNNSMRAYYDSIIDKKDFNTLKEIIDDNNCWKSEEDTPKYVRGTEPNRNNIFRITSTQNNELVFSNMFFYYFDKYPKIRSSFFTEVLKIETTDTDCDIKREENHIDLKFYKENEYLIIIENKIRSNINGLKTKLDTEKTPLGEIDNSTKYIVEKGTKKIFSQLSDYYYVALNKIDESKIHMYFLTPEYYSNYDLDMYKYGNKYTKLTYKDMYNFFTTQTIKNELENDSYYLDFINALYKHSTPTDDEFKEMIYQRLDERI